MQPVSQWRESREPVLNAAKHAPSVRHEKTGNHENGGKVGKRAKRGKPNVGKHAVVLGTGKYAAIRRTVKHAVIGCKISKPD